MLSGRVKPYTRTGVRRLTCVVARCKNKAHATWQTCADGGLHRPICAKHDRALNRMVLVWMGDPEVEQKMKRYTGAT